LIKIIANLAGKENIYYFLPVSGLVLPGYYGGRSVKPTLLFSPVRFAPILYSISTGLLKLSLFYPQVEL
jgi:hypothetical protein